MVYVHFGSRTCSIATHVANIANRHGAAAIFSKLPEPMGHTGILYQETMADTNLMNYMYTIKLILYLVNFCYLE
jgi:hypothetical protein